MMMMMMMQHEMATHLKDVLPLALNIAMTCACVFIRGSDAVVPVSQSGDYRT